MQYYTLGFNSCALDATSIVQNLPTTSAQCGAFALLLESALAMNGIHSNWTTVQPTDGSRMIVNNWALSPSPTYATTVPSVAPWVYKLVLNIGDYMFPALTSYGDLANLPGLAGQGEGGTTPPYTPVEKVFDLHFIVQIPTAPGNQYYDPSYGVTYPSAAGFESKVLAGYAKYLGNDVVNGSNSHFRVYSTSPPNITFTPVPSSSM